MLVSTYIHSIHCIHVIYSTHGIHGFNKSDNQHRIHTPRPFENFVLKATVDAAYFASLRCGAILMCDNGINSDAAYFASLRCHLSDFGEYLFALPLCAASPVTTPNVTETLRRAHMMRAGLCTLASEHSATAQEIVTCRGMIERAQQRLEAHDTGWAVKRHGSKYLVLEDSRCLGNQTGETFSPGDTFLPGERLLAAQYGIPLAVIGFHRASIGFDRSQVLAFIRVMSARLAESRQRGTSSIVLCNGSLEGDERTEDPWQDWRGNPWEHWRENPWQGWQSDPWPPPFLSQMD